MEKQKSTITHELMWVLWSYECLSPWQKERIVPHLNDEPNSQKFEESVLHYQSVIERQGS